MINLNSAKDLAVKAFGQIKLATMAHGPTVMLGAGTIGVVGATVMACKATLHLDTVMAETQKDIDRVHEGREKFDLEKYTDDDYKKDLVAVYVRRGVSLAKLYGPSAAVGALSLVCILSSHIILRKRNIALVAAYKILDETYKKYRARVVEEYGADKDYQYAHGLREQTITEVTTNGKGKEITVEKKVLTRDPNGRSDYAQEFDRKNVNYQKNMDLNRFFLQSMQNHLNHKLKATGFVFLSDVQVALGLPRTDAGQIVGWVYDQSDQGNPEKDKHQDQYIDFDLDNPLNKWVDENDPLNENENPIYLDFNVDGPIWHALGWG